MGNGIKLSSGNISSNDPIRAVFTNPTEIAHWRGNLKHHYPVVFRGTKYADAECAYRAFCKSSPDRYELCIEIIVEKLKQYPVLMRTIGMSGGEVWIKQCSHHVYYNKSTYWEGDGLKSGFIKCLLAAYKITKMEKNEI